MGRAMMSGVVPKLKAPSGLPEPGRTLNDYTWAEISKISTADVAASYFATGDTHAVLVNGAVGTLAVNQTFYAFILGINHNEEIEGKGITFGCFKTAQTGGVDVALIDANYDSQQTVSGKFVMNTTLTNAGGWNGCHIRKTVLGSDSAPTNPTANTLLAAFPSDLRAVMKSMTIYTDNVGGGTNTASNVTSTVDYLPLLAACEISGSSAYANSAERNYQKQYAYYLAGNSKAKYRHSATGATANWWNRSPSSQDFSSFCLVNASSEAIGTTAAFNSRGVAPMFRV